MESNQATATSAVAASSSSAGRESVALTAGRGGILGMKAGMTQVYNDGGRSLAVTVIDLAPTVITQVKTKASEGYNAIQVGFVSRKATKGSKSEQGHARAAGESFYHYQEIRLPEDAKLDGLTVGKVLSPEFVKEGDLVDVTSRSKGKGFQGGMKRFHMHGGNKTHGASVSHRSLGSIGNRADPAKCFKNKKMAGQMGSARVTVQNVRVVKVDVENQLMLVHGSVPGPKSGVVMVRRAVKVSG
jgi:large subunit ribosomal protein L3